ncbi:MAG: D-alanine--D-alanine ligase [Saprospiraceae bacterium]|nr:D-alanine--D-alanine ligase [Saprospiraceae bacterium]
MTKTHLLVLCGGKSAEHAISLISAWNLLKTISHESFDVTLIAIDKTGNWWLQDTARFLEQEAHPERISIPQRTSKVWVNPGPETDSFYLSDQGRFLPQVDVVFPLLHGPNGEDGSIQGLLKHLQIPYIGPSVLGASICMDKDVAKRLMLQANIPTSDFIALYKSAAHPDFQAVKEQLGLPLFVKPANLGSSVGINKVVDASSYHAALEEAFQFDEKIIIEAFVEGQEVECAVLGNDDCIVSEPGTYIHEDEFFDYDTKYLKGKEVGMQIPYAKLNAEQIEALKAISLQAYKALECKGLARVDTFVTPEGEFLVNEINTLPGFTQNSMYPLLMDAAGIPYNNLIKKLCALAISRFRPMDS